MKRKVIEKTSCHCQTLRPKLCIISPVKKKYIFISIYQKCQSHPINLSSRPWGTDPTNFSYSRESRTEVYRFMLNFNVEILVSKNTQLLRGVNSSIVDSLFLSCFVIDVVPRVSHLSALGNEVVLSTKG